MLSRSGILCAGAWCVDRNIQINSWPAEETVANILGQFDHGGCPGHNMATALRRLQVPFPVEAMGLIGDDNDGRFLTQICDEFNIKRQGLEQRKGVDTSITFAMTSGKTKKRTFFHQPGAMAVQCPDDFDFSLTNCRIVHLGLAGLMPKLDGPWQNEVSGWVSVLKKARAVGLQTNMEMVSVAPEKIRAAGLPMLGYLDTLIINDFEAGALAEITTVNEGIADTAACRLAAEKLMSISQLTMLAIHYPTGGIAFTRSGEVAEHASVNVPTAEIKGNNGAGDCFAAGMLYGHHESWSLLRSLKLAHAAAAASLRSPATTESVVDAEQCLTLADHWGWHQSIVRASRNTCDAKDATNQ